MWKKLNYGKNVIGVFFNTFYNNERTVISKQRTNKQT